MALTVTLGAYTVPVAYQSLSFNIKANMRTTCAFKIVDTDGSITAILDEYMPVTITIDELGGLFWTGYANSVRIDPLPGSVTRIITIDGIDQVWLAQKRWFTSWDFYAPTMAGDIAAFLHQNYLAAEHVNALYALRYDWGNAVSNPTGTHFGQGTLSNTVATPTGLSLLPGGSGTAFRKTETTTADFSVYTSYSNVAALSDQLQFASTQCIEFYGTANQFITHPYAWMTFVDGLNYAVVAGDKLVYDIFISSSSPGINGAIDIGYVEDPLHMFRDTHTLDQYGNDCHPSGQDLTGYADDRWYHREIPLTAIIGMHVQWASGGFDIGTLPSGTYTMWAKNIKIMNGSTLKQTLYTGGSFPANSPWEVVNFTPFIMDGPFWSYADNGYRVGPANNIASVAVVQSSQVNFTEAVYNPPKSIRTYPSAYTFETSWDGITWQSAVSGQPIKGLLPGFLTTGVSLYIRQILNLASNTPLQTPAVLDDVLIVTPGSVTAAQQMVYKEYNAGTFGAGTISGTTYDAIRGGLATGTTTSSALCINGKYDNWDATDLTSQTVFSTHSGSQFIQYHGVGLFSTTGGDCKCRLDWAGNWQNFVCEFDVYWQSLGGNYVYGILYRTTYWADGDTYGYIAGIDQNGVLLGRGTNSATNTWTPISHVGVTWVNNNWYHVKVVVNGNNHRVSVNNVEYINIPSDATFPATGGVGLRFYNNSGASNSGRFSNWGIQGYSGYSGQRTSPGQSLATVATAYASIVQWNEIKPSGTNILVEASIDGGSTWQTCTNGGTIPQITAGLNVSASTLKIRETLTTNQVSKTPYLEALTVVVVGQAAATGTRIAPALPLTGITDCGDTSVSWQANTPTNTSVTVQISKDGGGTYSTIANSGDPVPGLTVDGDVLTDWFTLNSSANYTNTNYASGANITTVNFDTANSRLILTGGTRGLYIWNSGPPSTTADNVTYACLDRSDRGGMVIRYVSAGNFYMAVIADASASIDPGKVRLYKVVGGTATSIGGPYSISFTRGTPHIAQFKISINTMTFVWDGTQIFSVTDTQFSGQTGKQGFFNETGTSQWYWVRGQSLGSNVSALSLVSKVTLQTTDPAVMPVLTSLTVGARSTNLQSGALIASTSWSYNNTIADCLTDISSKSKGYWRIDKNKQLYFQLYTFPTAPYCITTADIIGGSGTDAALPSIYIFSPAYRNVEYIKGGNDLVSYVNRFVGNYIQTTFSLATPVGPGTVPTITLNNLSQAVGILGTDTGKDWYYVDNSTQIVQDPGGTAIGPNDTLVVTYYGNTPAFGSFRDEAEITAFAAIDGSSGIVDHVTSGREVALLTTDACVQMAQALVELNGVVATTLAFTTQKWGIWAADLVTVFIPELNMMDRQFSVLEIQMQLKQLNGVLVPWSRVSLTDGPDLGTWGRWMSKAWKPGTI